MPEEPFDTVDDLRNWLDEEEPTVEEAEEALELETDHDDRTTAKMALNEYINEQEEDDEEPEDEVPEGEQKYVVMRPFSGYERGQIVHLDPDDPQTQMYVRDGRLERRPN